MKRHLSFRSDERAASAAEFALILPVALLFLLGLIDVGRYTWTFNQMEKATQAGARWAAATDLVASGLRTYSFAVNGIVSQGEVVESDNFGGIVCTSADGTVTCDCRDNSACAFGEAADQAAFDLLAQRMFDIYPGIAKDNIRIEYDNALLGFSGDPNGPDVAPLITVSIVDKEFPLWFMLGRTVKMPDARYTITSEDGQGDFSY